MHNMCQRLNFQHCKYSSISFVEKDNIALALTPRELYLQSIVNQKGWYYESKTDVSKEIEDALYFDTSCKYLCNYIFRKNYDTNENIEYLFHMINESSKKIHWKSKSICFTFIHCGFCHHIVSVGPNAHLLQCGEMGVKKGFFCFWCEE